MDKVTPVTVEEAAMLLGQDGLEYLFNPWRFEERLEDYLLESFLPGQLETGA